MGYPIFFVVLDLPTTRDTSWDIPAFLLLLHRHTNCDTAWDIPSFSLPSIYQALGALLRTPPLFHHPSFVTQTMTSVGISQHFRPHPLGTLSVTSNLSAIVLQAQKEHFGITFNSAVLLDYSLDII